MINTIVTTNHTTTSTSIVTGTCRKFCVSSCSWCCTDSWNPLLRRMATGEKNQTPVLVHRAMGDEGFTAGTNCSWLKLRDGLYVGLGFELGHWSFSPVVILLSSGFQNSLQHSYSQTLLTYINSLQTLQLYSYGWLHLHNSTLLNNDFLLWSFIVGFKLFQFLQQTTAFDNPAKCNILLVHPGSRLKSDVEL